MRGAVCFLAAAFLSVAAAGPLTGLTAEAAGSHVYDFAELFDEQELEEIEEMISDSRDEVDFDLVVMTTADTGGQTTEMYAADQYEAAGFGEGRDHSGIMFLIDMDNREIYFSTEGGAIRYFTEARIENMLDHVYEGVADGDYMTAVEIFLADAVYYGQEGIVSGQYDLDTETGRVSAHRRISLLEFLLAAGVSLIVAGGAVMTVKRQYDMEEDPRQTANHNMAYRADSELRVSEQKDRLLGTFVTSAIIAGAVARGMRHSGGSENSSSKRSPTYHSSSGRTHGGGGRKF